MMHSDTMHYVFRHVIPAAYELLPGGMASAEATAELLTIGLQESDFAARRQGGTRTKVGNGPARSFWQFERMGGVAELLGHPRSRATLDPILDLLVYPVRTPEAIHEAMQHHDVLACVLARLLLWKDPRTMPKSFEADKGWAIYLARWRPGKPHPEKWPGHFAAAWNMVNA